MSSGIIYLKKSLHYQFRFPQQLFDHNSSLWMENIDTAAGYSEQKVDFKKWSANDRTLFPLSNNNRNVGGEDDIWLFLLVCLIYIRRSSQKQINFESYLICTYLFLQNI